MNLNFKHLIAIMIMCLVGLNFGCNKDFENTLPKSYKDNVASLGDGSKKVLYIILDGVTGASIKALAPQNITLINEKATYTFDGLTDDNLNVMTNAAAWTTMLTGAEYTTHNVTTEDFSDLNLQPIPTIFTRIKSTISNARMVSIASTAAFNDKLAGDATVKQNLTDDAAVKTAVLSELSTNNPSMVVAQFHGAETAGAANGYTASTPAYANAIKTIDTYIGEILTALKARKGFSGENWLVVLASNKGGGVSGGAVGSNIYGDMSRNTYVAFYNPRFSSFLINKPDDNSYPFLGQAVRMVSNVTTNGQALLSNASVGDFGTSGEYTFQMKVRSDGGTASNYAHFCGNMSNYTAREGLNATGWDYMTWGDSYYFSFGGAYAINVGVNIRDGKWHTLAFKLFNSGATRYVALFQDGKKVITADITGKDFTNPAALHLGPGKATSTSDGASISFRDVAIYNYALTDDDLIVNMKKEISLVVPNADKLLGCWPANEGSGTVLKDISAAKNNFTINAATSWLTFNEASPFVGGNISQEAYGTVPNGIDIPVMIYYWMNIAVPSQWGLTGKLYSPKVNLPIN
ncbi:LamG-like jellyroll fold domain-containing protein [Pedobacter frigiditerrae]|nr:LamG-like jellyroll fold domain-containing protein [Pedobacter frigiditerrae]